MKVAFIVPKDNDKDSPLSQLSQCRILPPVGLARMAGLIGKKGNIALVDERIESARHERKANIAVIFINSYNRQRAYNLARLYKQCGSTVVFTGPVLNTAAEDADKHADCLLLGSAEDSLSGFLSDYRQGKVKRFYHSRGKTHAPATIHLFRKPKLSLAS